MADPFRITRFTSSNVKESTAPKISETSAVEQKTIQTGIASAKDFLMCAKKAVQKVLYQQANRSDIEQTLGASSRKREGYREG